MESIPSWDLSLVLFFFGYDKIRWINNYYKRPNASLYLFFCD